MPSGFFLGGVAQGMKNAEELGLKRDALLQDKELKSRGLDLQKLGLDLKSRELDQTKELKNRALAIQQQSVSNANTRAILAEADKQIDGTMDIVSETVKNALAAGRDPATVSKAIQPLVQSAKALAVKAGRDPGSIDTKVNVLMAQPTVAETAVAKAKAGVSAADAVSTATGVTQREALQGQGVLKAEPRNSSVMEGIRGKIAAGEPLSTGEQKVYDDALKADPLARFLALSQGQAAPPATPTQVALPPEAAKQLKEGVVTTFANGQKWSLKGGKPVQVQ